MYEKFLSDVKMEYKKYRTEFSAYYNALQPRRRADFVFAYPAKK